MSSPALPVSSPSSKRQTPNRQLAHKSEHTGFNFMRRYHSSISDVVDASLALVLISQGPISLLTWLAVKPDLVNAPLFHCCVAPACASLACQPLRSVWAMQACAVIGPCRLQTPRHSSTLRMRVVTPPPCSTAPHACVSLHIPCFGTLVHSPGAQFGCLHR